MTCWDAPRPEPDDAHLSVMAHDAERLGVRSPRGAWEREGETICLFEFTFRLQCGSTLKAKPWLTSQAAAFNPRWMTWARSLTASRSGSLRTDRYAASSTFISMTKTSAISTTSP